MSLLDGIQEECRPLGLIIHIFNRYMEMVEQFDEPLHPHLPNPLQPMSSTERMTSRRNLEENGTRL